MPAWEYLLIIFEQEAMQKGTGWEYKNTHYIWRAGNAEAEVRSEANWVELINELGSDGWELVESTILQSTIVAKAFGYTEVSYPVRLRHTFKRQSMSGGGK